MPHKNVEPANGANLFVRRALFAALVLLSAMGAITGLTFILGLDGLGTLDFLMITAFALTLPWTMIGFWNAVIGFIILRLERNQLASMPSAIRGRTAILMCVHNEDPERVFKHLGQIGQDLTISGEMDKFDIHLLSDTTDRDIAAQEEARFAQWQAAAAFPNQLNYRRRQDNSDHKNGNLWEFLKRCQGEYDYFLLLDADSLMSAERITQMARSMDSDEHLGIYQSLIVGLPNPSPFTRIFQFGMRQGMRSYTTGAVWWQGGAGPCWGHNVIIRMQPFIDHCALPRLAGSPPLGGLVLSHDQVEAALMRGAGYDVRVLVEERGSYEENPPTLQDFITRDLRWCQGNMQYFRLLAMKGITGMGRLQLALAILMYAAAPAWLGFMLLGLGQAASLSDTVANGPFDPALAGFAIGLFVMMMTFNLTPKIAGIADVLCRADARSSYGGTAMVLTAGVIEFFFSLFLAPIVAVAQTIFILGLLRGRTIRWDAQRRSQHEITLSDAIHGLWPQTLLGMAMLGTLFHFSPTVLPWGIPVFAPLLLAVPFAWLTSRRWLGERMIAAGICATPEEIDRPAIMNLRHPPAALPILGQDTANVTV